MYDLGVFKSTKFKTPIINVGNLSVGGSGKSPMVMYLAKFLSKHYRTGVLSRGYGRLTKGYEVTNYESNYKMVGDEAMQLFERFKNRFVIAVSEERVPGAKKVIDDMDLEVLVLDDAMHQVYTGITIKTADKVFTETDVADVTLDQLSGEEINYYIQHYKPFDKAGSYGIQEWLGMAKITNMKGSFYTIMGLPTHLVYKILKEISLT